MSEFKIFEEINNSKGYEIALATTFNLELKFFERFVLNTLFDNGIRKVSLFVDAKQLNIALQTVESACIGKKYMVTPVEMNSSFHPKIILLLGKDRAKLFVSSANLTISGYALNNEIFNTFLLDNDYPDNLDVINEAISFFEDLKEEFNCQDNELFDEVRGYSYYKQKSKKTPTEFLSNFKESILNQVKDKIDSSAVTHIDIATPFYDNGLNAIHSIKKIFANADINIYLQNHKSKFPLKRKYDDAINSIYPYSSLKNGDAFYHGKVIRFITDKESYILYGSANCTGSALAKSYVSDKGNIEVDVLEHGKIEEFNDFFDEFILVNDQELDVEELDISISDEDFFFKSGVLDLDCDLVLRIGYKKRYNDLKLTLFKNVLKYDYSDDLIVYVPRTILADADDNLLIIEGAYSEKKVSIKCWFNDYSLIESYRDFVSKDQKIHYSFDVRGLEFLEQRQRLLDALSLSSEEMNYERDVCTNVEQESRDEDEESGNEIVSFIIPPKDILEKREMYLKINEFRRGYVEHFHKKIHPEEHRQKNSDNTSASIEQTEEPTDDQLNRFSNLVNRRLKKFVSTNPTNIFTIQQYIETMLIFEESFEMFPHDFDYAKILPLKIKYFENLQKFDVTELDDEYIEALISITLIDICENHFLLGDDDTYLFNRSILTWLNDLYDLREIYERYLSFPHEILNKWGLQNFRYETINEYIDSLFGYKPWPEVQKIIEKEYPESAIIIENEILFVNIETNQITQYLKESVLKSVMDYCKNKQDFDSAVFIIKNNKKGYSVNADPIAFLRHEINFMRETYAKVSIYKSGKRVKEIINWRNISTRAT